MWKYIGLISLNVNNLCVVLWWQRTRDIIWPYSSVAANV